MFKNPVKNICVSSHSCHWRSVHIKSSAWAEVLQIFMFLLDSSNGFTKSIYHEFILILFLSELTLNDITHLSFLYKDNRKTTVKPHQRPYTQGELEILKNVAGTLKAIALSQPAFTCSKLIIETLEQGAK